MSQTPEVTFVFQILTSVWHYCIHDVVHCYVMATSTLKLKVSVTEYRLFYRALLQK